MCLNSQFSGNKGKTSGSRVRFYRPTDGKLIDLHKSHPNLEMDVAAVEVLKAFFWKA